MNRLFLKILLLTTLLLNVVHAAKQDSSILLLTPHYGVLNQKDLELYAKNISIQAFNPEHASGIGYWQCFKSKNILVSYRSWDDEFSGEYCDMEITVTVDDNNIHQYGLRRAWPLEYCQRKKMIWNKIMRNQEYTCLGGIYIGKNTTYVKDKAINISGWIFDKIKTKIGCNAYFGTD